MSLGMARWIATVMYFTALGVYPVIGLVVRVQQPVEGETLRVLGPAVLAAGVGAYVVSLLLERTLLAQALSQPEREAKAATAAVIVAAVGESLGVFGLVLALLGSPNWAWGLYALCAAHGLHLLVRWPRYARAAEGAPY